MDPDGNGADAGHQGGVHQQCWRPLPEPGQDAGEQIAEDDRRHRGGLVHLVPVGEEQGQDTEGGSCPEEDRPPAGHLAARSGWHTQRHDAQKVPRSNERRKRGLRARDVDF